MEAHKKFTVVWQTSGVGHAYYVLTASKQFQVLSSISFFLLSSRSIAASWQKLQVLATLPYCEKNRIIPFSMCPQSRLHLGSRPTMLSEFAWPRPGGCLHPVSRLRWKQGFPLADTFVSPVISPEQLILPQSKRANQTFSPPPHHFHYPLRSWRKFYRWGRWHRITEVIEVQG